MSKPGRSVHFRWQYVPKSDILWSGIWRRSSRRVDTTDTTRPSGFEDTSTFPPSYLHDYVRPKLLLAGLFDLCNQLFDNSRLSERAEIAQLILLTVDNLAKNATHDLATARLGEIADDVDLLGSGKRTNDFAHLKGQLLGELALVINVKFTASRQS